MLEEHLTVIFDALDHASVRYLVVGGLAVVAHGHARFTADLDLAVALDSTNSRRTVDALIRIGYVPVAPVDPFGFSDARVRSQWVKEKQMVVFQMVSSQRPETSVDLFTTEPFDFDQEYLSAPRIELLEGRLIPVVSYETLVSMKLAAGRPKDLEDVETLRRARGHIDLPDTF